MADKINVVIVDDEPDSIEVLKLMLSQLNFDLEIVGTANNVASGCIVIDQLKPNLVFLDIRMPDGTGFNLLEKVNYKEFDVVFITAYDEYALKAFEFTAIHYLLKPIELTDIEEALKRYLKYNSDKAPDKLNRYQNYVNNQIEKIALPTNEGLQIVRLDEIIYLEADGPYTMFNLCNDKKIIVSKSLNTYQELLQNQDFIRTHNKYIVNLKFVVKYSKGSGGEILMENNIVVNVSVRKKQEFLTKLKKYTINK